MTEHHTKVLKNYLRSHRANPEKPNPTERSPNSPLVNSQFKNLNVSTNSHSGKSAKKKITPKDPVRIQLPRRPVRRRVIVIDDIPDEVLLQIFGFLPANDLLTSASVCKRWLKLSNDDILWQRLYVKYGQLKRHESIELQLKVHGEIRWKRECIKRCTEKRNSKLKQLLKKTSLYTLLPADTNKVIEKLGISWHLVLIDSDKTEHTFNQSNVFHFQTSTTVRWYSLAYPPINTLYQLAIYASAPVFFNKDGSAMNNSPCQRSLLLKLKLNDDIFKEHIGADDVIADDVGVRLHCLQNRLLLGTWNDGGEIAFVSLGLHNANLIQRCLYGSTDSIYVPLLKKPPTDDIDPQYGLHDYTCILELRNQRAMQWSEQFTFLHTSKSNIVDGFAVLVLIREDVPSDHSRTSKKLSLPWKTEIFKGIVQNVCIMDLTVHDEFKQTMWAISCPVPISELDDHTAIDFTYEGSIYRIKYSDDVGQVVIQLIWIEEQDVFMVTKAELHLSCKAINAWFGTKY